MNNIIFKEAGLEDVYTVSAFLAKCWKCAYKGLVDDEYLFSLSDLHWVGFLESKLPDKLIRCLTARENGEIVGVSIFGRSIADEYPQDGEVIALYVSQDYHGLKIGHELFKKSLQGLGETGFESGLVCVFKDNAKAVSFYRAHGFQTALENQVVRIGERDLQYLVMRKRLLN